MKRYATRHKILTSKALTSCGDKKTTRSKIHQSKSTIQNQVTQIYLAASP